MELSGITVAVIGLSGVAGCVSNPLMPEQSLYEMEPGFTKVACLQDAWIHVDVNGDGTDETGGPAYYPALGDSNCS